MPASLGLSLLGLWRDRHKAYAICGTIIAGLTALLYLVGIVVAVLGFALRS